MRPTGGNTFELDGDLTIREITKPVTLERGVRRDGRRPVRETPVLGFSATTTVDREAWDITWNMALETGGLLVGKKVELEIDVELLKSE